MWLWRKKTIKNVVVVVVEEEKDRNVVVAVVEENNRKRGGGEVNLYKRATFNLFLSLHSAPKELT